MSVGTMPHAKELEDILAIEQVNISPIVIKKLEENDWTKFQAENLAKEIATKKPAEVADSIIIGHSSEGIPADSYQIYTAANEIHRGSYWNAFSHIEKISDEKKEMREQLGRIAIEQCFDPVIYNRGKPEDWGGKARSNDNGPYTLLSEVISNPKSKLRHLVSIQDVEKCVNMAFVSFVKKPESFVSRQHLCSVSDEETRKAMDWQYQGFCRLLENAHHLDKNLVLKTVEENPEFQTGWHSYLYMNYIFKRFEDETTPGEKAKLFWPVLKDIMWPREQFDVLAEDTKLLMKYIKHARHPYCKQQTEKEFAEILTYGCGDTWQSVDFARIILGKRKLVQIVEETARNARGEDAENLVDLAISDDLKEYVNLATVCILKSYCVPREEDDHFDLKRKADHYMALDKIEHDLGTVPRGNPAWDSND